MDIIKENIIVRCVSCDYLIPPGVEKCPACKFDYGFKEIRCEACGNFLDFDCNVCPYCFGSVLLHEDTLKLEAENMTGVDKLKAAARYKDDQIIHLQAEIKHKDKIIKNLKALVKHIDKGELRCLK